MRNNTVSDYLKLENSEWRNWIPAVHIKEIPILFPKIKVPEKS